MNRLPKRPHTRTEIPTSSMADIAFLLLLFFLVTTTIDVDTGIGMVLPPPLEHPPPEVHDRNLLRVLVNAQGMLLVENERLSIDALRTTVKQHVMNCTPGYGCLAHHAERPNRAVVSIKTDRTTPYHVYVAVLDEVWMAYFEIWDEEARRQGFADYAAYQASLSDETTDVVRAAIKPQISIAEPD